MIKAQYFIHRAEQQFIDIFLFKSKLSITQLDAAFDTAFALRRTLGFTGTNYMAYALFRGFFIPSISPRRTCMMSTFISPVNDIDYAYIEVTTRSGRGPLIKKSPGFYAYNPPVPARPKEFYRPRYTGRDTPVKTDFRSTIHWEPDVVTDSTGTATITFYTSDRPGTYTIVAEGSNMDGLVGFGTGKISVKND